MVAYIRSDLDFILAQIKVAEKHAAYTANPPIRMPRRSTAWARRARSVPFLPIPSASGFARSTAIQQPAARPGKVGRGRPAFPELLDPAFRPADGTLFDPDGPGPAPAMPTSPNYNPSNNPNALVFDFEPAHHLQPDRRSDARQSGRDPEGPAVGGVVEANLANVALVQAIYGAFKPAADAEYQARVVMQNAKTAANALSDGDDATTPGPAEQAALDALATATSAHMPSCSTDLEAARAVRDAALEPFGITMDGDNVQITNVSPDVGLSAPFNSWFTLFGQFFDHGLDLVNKGGSGTVFVPLQPDDPLYVAGQPRRTSWC